MPAVFNERGPGIAFNGQGVGLAQAGLPAQRYPTSFYTGVESINDYFGIAYGVSVENLPWVPPFQVGRFTTNPLIGDNHELISVVSLILPIFGIAYTLIGIRTKDGSFIGTKPPFTLDLDFLAHTLDEDIDPPIGPKARFDIKTSSPLPFPSAWVWIGSLPDAENSHIGFWVRVGYLDGNKGNPIWVPEEEGGPEYSAIINTAPFLSNREMYIGDFGGGRYGYRADPPIGFLNNQEFQGGIITEISVKIEPGPCPITIRCQNNTRPWYAIIIGIDGIDPWTLVWDQNIGAYTETSCSIATYVLSKLGQTVDIQLVHHLDPITQDVDHNISRKIWDVLSWG
jgi:hypothetical protein